MITPTVVVALGLQACAGPTAPSVRAPEAIYSLGPAAGVHLAAAVRSGEGVLLVTPSTSGSVGVGGIGGILHASPGGSGGQALVSIGDDGLPASFEAAGFVVLFDNIRATLLDVAIVSPQGEVSVHRDVPHQGGFAPPPLQVGALLIGVNGESGPHEAELLRWASLTIKGAACVAAVALSAGTYGAAAAVAALSCSSFALSLIAELSDDELAEELSEAAGVFSCAIGTAYDCVLAVTTGGLDAAAMAEEVRTTNGHVIDAARGVIATGGGTVQVNLTWDGTSDLDLHVIEPSGFRISWRDRISPSGGRLDRDDINGFGPENVYWPVGVPVPSGVFSVEIHHFLGTATERYRLLVTMGLHTQLFHGVISPGEVKRIVSFEPGFILLDALQGTRIIRSSGSEVGVPISGMPSRK